MLTGAYPDDNNYDQLLNDNAIVTPHLRAVISHACAFEPSQRPQSVPEFHQTLLSATDSAAVSTQLPSDAQHATRVPRIFDRLNLSKRAIVLWSAAGAVLVIAAIVGGIISAGHLGITGPAKSPDSSMRSDGSSSNGSGAGNADNADGADGASGNNGTGTSGADAVADNPLELVESGWSVGQQGYVSYAFALRNTSTTLQVQYPEVAITGRAKDGSIVFSQTQTLNMAFPNQTIYDAGQAGQGTAPATVDFVVLSPNEYNVTEAQGTATFPISGISKVRNNDGGTTFNGEVRAVTDGFEPSDGQQIKVSLVLRDKQGAIIYGEMAFVDWPDNGQSMPF